MRLIAAGVMLITLTAAPARAADPSSVSPAARERGLYVTTSDVIAREGGQTRTLIDVVRRERFDQLTLYHLKPLLTDSKGVDRLATLMRRLRAAGIHEITAPVASVGRVTTITDLGGRNPAARFSRLVTELEYWNRCRSKAWEVPEETIRAECFGEMQALVTAMMAAADREKAAGRSLKIGAYLGSPTRAELQWLAARLDFIFLDFPVRTPQEATSATTPHRRYRLQRVAWGAEAGLELWPIFYARGEVPMQPWLRHHSLAETEEVFLERLAQHPELASALKKIRGFQYFADDGFAPTP